MKALHINRNYLGTSLHQIMVGCLDSLGVINQVFVPGCKTDVVSIKPSANVCVSECFKKIDRFFYWLKQFKIIRSIEKNIDIKSFDIIHAYTLFTDGNVAMKMAHKYKKPFVVAIRDTDLNDFFAKLFYLRGHGIKIMRAAERIFFLSETYRKEVFEKYIPKSLCKELISKTMIVPNGIDDFWFENRYYEHKKLDHNTVKLVFAGQVSKRKNVSAIKEAVDILRRKGIDVSLTVIGRVVDQKEFLKIKEDPRIIYLPAMPKEKLIEQYRKHDIFVMPSFTETFGLVYAEALTQGLPVVYSKGQGFDMQFEEGKVGYHCDAYDVSDIANAIEKVIVSYQGIQQNCVEAAEKFKWKDICNGYVSLYQKILMSYEMCKGR